MLSTERIDLFDEVGGDIVGVKVYLQNSPSLRTLVISQAYQNVFLHEAFTGYLPEIIGAHQNSDSDRTQSCDTAIDAQFDYRILGYWEVDCAEFGEQRVGKRCC